MIKIKWETFFLDVKYINGIKNGIGKEYDKDSGYLKFEGEYLNGIKNGKVKKYNCNGYIQFEGKYLNGIKNEKLKE